MIMKKLAFGAFVSFGSTVTILGSTMMSTTEAQVQWVGEYGVTEPVVVTTVVGKAAKKTKVQQAYEAAPTTTAAPTTAPAKQWLFVQAGTTCTLAQHATTGVYTLRATIGQDTVALTERPDRIASNIATQKFVNSFEDLFSSSSPNVAITFTGDQKPSSSSASLDGPLIVILSRPSIIGGLNGSSMLDIEYTMKQSESQSTVATIEQFLDASGSCSLFIDGSPYCAGSLCW